MSHTYTVVLSDAEYKAMCTVAKDPDDWIQNAAHNRARIAIEEIVKQEVERKFAAGEPITGTKDDIVLAADVKTVAEFMEEVRLRVEGQQ